MDWVALCERLDPQTLLGSYLPACMQQATEEEAQIQEHGVDISSLLL